MAVRGLLLVLVLVGVFVSTLNAQGRDVVVPTSSPQVAKPQRMEETVANSLVLNGGPGADSRLTLGDGAMAFELEVDKEGNFKIGRGERALFAIDRDGRITLLSDVKAMGSLDVDQLLVGGEKQWKLLVHDAFDKGDAPGWSDFQTSTCADETALPGPSADLRSKRYMLGGHCKFGRKMTTSKVFNTSTPHEHVRFAATFHFIDAWSGQCAWASLDDQYVWSECYDAGLISEKGGKDLCGDPNVAEGKFAVPIDVVLPHNKATIKVEFGSTLEVGEGAEVVAPPPKPAASPEPSAETEESAVEGVQTTPEGMESGEAPSPCEASWGVSDVQLFAM
eukprot:TRINITY_DN37118_c0_g1_i1.p1 TRINITY_DN37118_c0_g1~~TRINITY_DN37118_c0_g1_i1.p1  ORF type:complete len:343 (+),score=76.14 TRINITY_DN37118_c0_g1_i1:25-1029(+)